DRRITIAFAIGGPTGSATAGEGHGHGVAAWCDHMAKWRLLANLAQLCQHPVHIIQRISTQYPRTGSQLQVGGICIGCGQGIRWEKRNRTHHLEVIYRAARSATAKGLLKIGIAAQSRRNAVMPLTVAPSAMV